MLFRSGIAAASFVAIFFLGVPFPIIILAAAIAGFLGGRARHPAFMGGGSHGASGGKIVRDAETALGEHVPDHARPSLAWSLRISGALLALWLAPIAALLASVGPGNVFTQIALFFSKMAVVTFGGAYAVLAYVAQQAVENYGWLRPGEMLDGLGMAETTPGPLIIVTQFVGFMGAFRQATGLPPLLAATLGGLLTTWVTFVPCFLWIFLGAPFIEKLRGNKALSAALAAITAAVVGVVLNLAVWFALHTLFHQVRALPIAGRTLDVPVLSTLDPAAPRPKRPRWFGLDTRTPGEPQLVQVVARSSELDALRSGLMQQAVDPGEPLALSRGELSWRMLLRPDGQMPQGLPMLIEWGAQHPAQALPASGCALEAVTLSGVRESLTHVLGLHQVTLQASAQPAWSVRLKCPLGLVDLHSHRSIA